MAQPDGGSWIELVIRVGLLVVTALVVATVFGDDLAHLVGRGEKTPTPPAGVEARGSR
jgi:hypothetical protein